MAVSTRIRRVLNAVVVGLLALAVAVPAVAVHVTEPTAPVEDVWLILGEYPNLSETELACDGTDVVAFINLRIETFIKVADTPSEHWDGKIILEGAFINQHGREQWVAQWDSMTFHSNIGPHQPRVVNASQTNQKLTEFTKWRVLVRITGLESGRVFEESCIFTTG